MIEKENLTKDLKFYSQRAIGMATFLGGPLAAGYLIRENYLALNKPNEGKKSLIIGIISTIFLLGGIFMIPEYIIEKIPNQFIPLIYTGIIYVIVEKIHGTILNQHKEFENEFYSGWKAAGIGFISLIILSIGIFGYAFISGDGIENEAYDKEIAKFTKNEAETLVFYDHLNTANRNSLLQELNNLAIPKWEENIEIIEKANEIKGLPSELLEQNKTLLQYAELRLKAFELFRKAIREDTDKYAEELEYLHLEMEQLIGN